MKLKTRRNVLILGHTGLLGNQVFNTFSLEKSFNVKTLNSRWPSDDFKKDVLRHEGTIINCAGAIPQNHPPDYSINYEIPLFLYENNKDFIHPDTDCVFSGDLIPGSFYKKYDRMDGAGPYAESKKKFITLVSENSKKNNVRVIRTSIIGFDIRQRSLLSWFLKQASENNCCSGYENHIWNGITTLCWSQISKSIIHDWDSYEWLTQLGTSPITKFRLLKVFSEIFGTKCEIHCTRDSEKVINKCLETDSKLPEIEDQLSQLSSLRRG